MSSQDVTNGLKAYMGLIGTGLARLFRRDPAYQRTLLLHDTFRDRTYLTCDFWESRKACESFRQNNSEAYLALDKICEELTVAERKIGRFEQLADDK